MRATAVLAFALTSVAACAKAPDAKVTEESKPMVGAGAEAPADAGRVPGLPMPQQFPHFVWDAAAADASARDAAR